MIMATELLNQRIRDIKCSRQKQGFADPTPTLVDIEKTHILYVNAHFKPFAALGFEYGKVNSSQGSPQFGGNVTFSIPQFGDFFHDMAAHIVAGKAECASSNMRSGATLGTVADNGVNTLAGGGARDRGLTTVTSAAAGGLAGATALGAWLQVSAVTTANLAFANIPETWVRGFNASAAGAYDVPDVSAEAAAMGFSQPFGSRNSDNANANPVGAGTPETYSLCWSYTRADGAPVAGTESFRNWVAYADLPAGRTLKQVDFTVNNNPLDCYKRTLYAMHDQFAVPAHKKDAWRRALGHEVAQESHTASVVLPAVANARANVDGSNVFRQRVQVVKGYQTAKPQQDQFEAWAPLLFWFNRDPRLAIPSVSIPFGQRFITIQVADQAEVVFAVPGLYVQAEHVLKTFDAEPDAADTAVTMYEARCVVQRKPLFVTGSLPNDLPIQTFDLYINNIFVNPEIHDIYIHRIGFSLIRVHRFHEEPVNTEMNDIHLNQLKWPLEYMYAGMQPNSNRQTSYPTGSTPTSYNPDARVLWRRFNYALREERASVNRVKVPFNTVFLATGNVGEIDPANNAAAGACTRALTCEAPACCSSVGYNERRMIDSVRISAHGNILYNDFPSSFFNSYIPYTYGGLNISSPDDVGALLVTFGLYPGSYQPNGHINISRAREFFFRYTSTFLGAGNPVGAATAIFIGVCINFLLISDGSAVLRYST